jgi:hypothetical protein
MMASQKVHEYKGGPKPEPAVKKVIAPVVEKISSDDLNVDKYDTDYDEVSKDKSAKHADSFVQHPHKVDFYKEAAKQSMAMKQDEQKSVDLYKEAAKIAMQYVEGDDVQDLSSLKKAVLESDE